MNCRVTPTSEDRVDEVISAVQRAGFNAYPAPRRMTTRATEVTVECDEASRSAVADAARTVDPGAVVT